MKSRKTVEFSERFNKRWLTYATAAGAAGIGLLATTQPAWADIVYTPANLDLGLIFLDVNHDGIYDFRFFTFSTGGTGARGHYRTNLLRASPYRSGNGFADGAAPLKNGAVIGPTDSFTRSTLGLAALYRFEPFSGGRSSSHVAGAWANVLGYLGLEFQIDGQTHFGWVQLDVNFQSGFGTITGYAYNTVANQSLTAGQGQTPEPGTLGLLALGSLGIGLWSRRRAASTQ